MRTFPRCSRFRTSAICPSTIRSTKTTRRFVLSDRNPYFFRGKYAQGDGSPHTPHGYVWPLALIVQALTSSDPDRDRPRDVGTSPPPTSAITACTSRSMPTGPSSSRATISRGPTPSTRARQRPQRDGARRHRNALGLRARREAAHEIQIEDGRERLERSDRDDVDRDATPRTRHTGCGATCNRAPGSARRSSGSRAAPR